MVTQLLGSQIRYRHQMVQLLVLCFLSVGVAGVWYILLPLGMCICRPRFQSVNLLRELPVFWVKVFDK